MTHRATSASCRRGGSWPRRSTPCSRSHPGDRPLVVGRRFGRRRGADRRAPPRPAPRRARDPTAVAPRPGDRWAGRRAAATSRGPGGEYVFVWHDRWRVALGDITDPIEAPFAGIVRDVRPGIGITIRAAGRGIRGIVALGGPTRGRLQRRCRGRAALGRARRRAGRDDPRRRLAGRRRDADPGAGDGRRRDRRGRPVEQGAARLPRLRGPPARRPPPAAAVRGARPRRRRRGGRWPARSRPSSRRWPATRSRS